MSTDKRYKDLSFLNNLFESLGDNENMSTDDIKEELRSDGIDPDATLQRLMAAATQAAADSKRSVLDLAKKERLQQEAKPKRTFDNLINWSKEQLLAQIKSLSLEDNQIAAASYRDLEKLTEDNLRALLEDLELLQQHEITDPKNGK